MVTAAEITHRVLKLAPKKRKYCHAYIEEELLALIHERSLSDTINIALAQYFKRKGKIE